jgi:hypothetical protein
MNDNWSVSYNGSMIIAMSMDRGSLSVNTLYPIKKPLYISVQGLCIHYQHRGNV